MGSYQLHIVLADDDQDDRMLFEDAFNEVKMAHSLDMVNDGYALMNYLALAEKLPDIILLDLSLPEMDGAEFMEKLRANREWEKLKVLIISGWDNLADRAREVGADGFLRKPFQIAQFYKQLEVIFNESSSENTLSF